jgi:asparagine synthase (glutamine-hydrolysing)
MSDVPLGLFLSGGLDSSALAGLMARMVKTPIRTFSVGLPEADANELDYARLVARSVRSVHREVVVTPDEFFDELPRLIRHEDEPIAFTSSVPLYFVSRLAAEDVKVVLTGEGADELFLGYHRYRITHWNDRLGRAYRRPGAGGAHSGLQARWDACRVRLQRYARRTFLALAPDSRSSSARTSRCSRRDAAGAARDPAMLAARDPYHEALACYADAAGGDLDRMSRADLQTYLVELLMKQDQMSMAASIESRVPFLDHELRRARRRDARQREAQGLADEGGAAGRDPGRRAAPILTRRKMGFPVPVGRWLRGPFRLLVDDLVLGPRALERGLFDPGALRRLAHAHRTAPPSTAIGSGS